MKAFTSLTDVNLLTKELAPSFDCLILNFDPDSARICMNLI